MSSALPKDPRSIALLLQPVQRRREVSKRLAQKMKDGTLTLHDARRGEQPGGHDRAAGSREQPWPDEEVREAGLVLERQEDRSLSAARPLANQGKAANGGASAGGDVPQRARREHVHGVQPAPQRGERVVLQGQAQGGVVLDSALAGAHRR